MMAEAPNPKRRRVDDPLEYNFIEKPSEDFHCPVTMEILTEPHQTLCCGNHLSQETADRLKREGKPCPMCNRSLNTVPDKFFKRQVNQLKVRCSKKASGCNWVGELGDLEKHLSEGSVDGECQYMTVACPLSCGDHIQRGRLEEHKSVCPQQQFMCYYCDYEGTYKNVMEDHWFECEKRPIQCPNKCGENTLVPRHLQQHLDIACPLQVVMCKFSYTGCNIECQRQEMQEHLDGNMQSHLTMVSEMTCDLQYENDTQQQRIAELTGKSNTQGKRIQSLTHQIQILTSQVHFLASALKPGALTTQQLQAGPPPVFIPPPDFVMTNFKQLKNDDDIWFSPPFYSHIGGYKLCISVDANGWDDGWMWPRGKHVGVTVYMMRGEYDDNLKWPFKGEVRVQLLNQRGNHSHFEKALLRLSHYQESLDGFDQSIFARVVGCKIAMEGWGYPQFIAHTKLRHIPVRDYQYLMNDCLKFRITEIELYNTLE